MPRFFNLRGYTGIDPLDNAAGAMPYVLYMGLAAVVGLLFYTIEGQAVLNIVRYSSPWVVPLATLAFLVVLAPLVVLLRKSTSLLIYTINVLPPLLIDLYQEAQVRAAGGEALWMYTPGTFISVVPVPLRFLWAWSFDAIIMGLLPLWGARLLAARLYPASDSASQPSSAQYDALFAAEWTRETVDRPRRDAGFWVLRLLGLGYAAYLVLLAVGALGAAPWPEQIAGLLSMTYANPALALNTFGKVGVMVLLAFIGAFNVRLRWHCTLGLFAGHLVSTVASLGFYAWGGSVAAVRNFLLTSALVDGAMVLIFVWLLIAYRAEKANFVHQRAFPEFYSVPARITRTILHVFAVSSWALGLVALAWRMFSDGRTGLGAVFGGPDPILSNTLTLYATVGVLAWMLAQRERLRQYLFGVLIFPMTVGTVAAVLWFVFVDAVAITTRGGESVQVDRYFAVYLAVNILLLALLHALRKMFYNIEYLITAINPSSANNAMSVYDAFFEQDYDASFNREGAAGGALALQEQSMALQSIDRFVGDVRGRKRGLLNFPFWVLEHLLSPLCGLRPPFSTMHHDERRHFLRTYLLRLPPERQRAMVPALAEIAYAVGVALHAIVSFAYFSYLGTGEKIGYVPPDARDRLQGDEPSGPPPFAAVAPLPKDPQDASNNKPERPTPHPLPAPRLSTPVNEPQVPAEVDYVIMGSGAGGAVMAYRLASAQGIDASRILLVERGARYSPLQDFNDNEMQMIPKLYKEGGLQQTKKFDMVVLQGECVGGTTVVNNAVCFRMGPEAAAEWREQYDLPVDDLAAEYDRVAAELGIGRLDDTAINRRVRQRFEAGVAGYNAGLNEAMQLKLDNPLLVNARDLLGDGLWNLGNKRLRKRSMLETYIPWAEGRGVRIASNTAAVRFVTDGDRRANAVLLRSATGMLRQVRVRKAVIVAGGVIASSHFLMRSGLRGNVGKHLSCNFAFPVAFRFDEVLNAFDGTQITLGALDPANRAVFETYFNPPAAFALSIPFFFEVRDAVMQDYPHYVNFGALVGSESNGEVQVKADILNGRPFTWHLGQRDQQRIRYALNTLVAIGQYAGATDVVLPLRPGVHFSLDAARANAERFQATLDAYPLRMEDVLINTAHPQGGNRMAGDASPWAATRVVNGRFQVDGYDNVFVADASLFPSSIGVNPQWTVMALSSLAAQQVLDHS